MVRFLDKITNKEKKAFSITNQGDYFLIRFTENGSEYKYFKDNIKILQNVKYEQQEERLIDTSKLQNRDTIPYGEEEEKLL